MSDVFRVKQIELGYSTILRSAMNADDLTFVREELIRNAEFVANHMRPATRELYEAAGHWLRGRDKHAAA